MRKNISVLAAIFVVISLVVVISIAHATASVSNNKSTMSGSSSSTVVQKPIPTYPSYTTTNKHTTPVPTVGSCPGPLPQPGIVSSAVGHGDPTYNFTNLAIVVSNGKAWTLAGGSLWSNPNQGVIEIVPFPTDPCKDLVNHENGTPYPQTPVIVMPSLHGAITITGVASTGTAVSFKAADGTTGHFDYMAQAFRP